MYVIDTAFVVAKNFINNVRVKRLFYFTKENLDSTSFTRVRKITASIFVLSMTLYTRFFITR